MWSDRVKLQFEGPRGSVEAWLKATTESLGIEPAPAVDANELFRRRRQVRRLLGKLRDARAHAACLSALDAERQRTMDELAACCRDALAQTDEANELAEQAVAMAQDSMDRAARALVIASRALAQRDAAREEASLGADADERVRAALAERDEALVWLEKERERRAEVLGELDRTRDFYGGRSEQFEDMKDAIVRFVTSRQPHPYAQSLYGEMARAAGIDLEKIGLLDAPEPAQPAVDRD